MRSFGICVLIISLVIGSCLSASRPAIAAAPPAEPPIVAERAITIDAETGAILFDRNASQRAAPASLTKLFTALFAIESTPLQRRMSISMEDLVGEASAGLGPGENVSFETLLYGLLLASGNDSAMTIARNVGESQSPSELNGVTSFVKYANERIAELGLGDTHLVNPHGLDAQGHYSSAHDIAAIAMHALQTEPAFLAAISSPGYIADGHHFAQTNQLLGNYPGAIGGKTGITDEAGFCLMGIAHRDGRTIVSVIMGSTPEAWYSDVMTLFDHGFATLAVPGLASLKPSITIAGVEPIPATVDRSAVTQNLRFQPASDGTLSVRSASSTNASSWPLWRWPLGATLAMFVVLVCAVQTRALIELQNRPLAGRRRPRPVQSLPKQASHRRRQHSVTQPFTTIGNWDRSSSSYPVWSGSIGD